jgi:hypothetical protein
MEKPASAGHTQHIQNGGQKEMNQENISAKLNAWQQANPWFGKDIKATHIVLSFHLGLLESGIEADSDEYFSKLDIQISLAKQLGILKIKQPSNRSQTNRRPRKKRCKAA